MKRYRIYAGVFAIIGIIVGFYFGLNFGEKMYVWYIIPLFENPHGEIDMSIVWTAISCGITSILAAIAVWQTSKANKISAKILDIEHEKAKADEQASALEVIKHKIALEQIKNENTIMIEINEAKLSEQYENLNEYDGGATIDFICLRIKNKNNLINHVVIKEGDSLIADKTITITPFEEKVLRLHLKTYKKDELLLDLFLRGNTSFVTAYKLKLIVEKHTQQIEFKEKIFLSCEEDTGNS